MCINLSILAEGIVHHNRRDEFEWALEQRRRNFFILRGICNFGAREGRIDLLNEVWSYVTNDTEDVRDFFGDADNAAARNGNLDALKWLDGKGLLDILEWIAVEALGHGQLHILKWLKEEKGLD